MKIIYNGKGAFKSSGYEFLSEGEFTVSKEAGEYLVKTFPQRFVEVKEAAPKAEAPKQEEKPKSRTRKPKAE